MMTGVSNALHIIHVIPEEARGGAELIVCQLQEGLDNIGLSCERVHFCGQPIQRPPVTHFGHSHNSVRNIFDLRQLLKDRLHSGISRLVLHSHLTHGFYFSLLARAKLPITWLHTEHNTTNRLRKINLLRPVMRQSYLKCDQVIAISEGVKDALQADLGLPNGKITRIYNGARDFGIIDRPPLSGRRPRFVSVGSLTRQKGFDVALRGLAASSLADWEYTIVGEGPQRGALQELTIELGIADRVRLEGWADPAAHLHYADIQLIPSRFEGFGLVAVEGMSTGLRLLASNVEGLREVVGTDRNVARLVDRHELSESWTTAIEAEVATLTKSLNPTSVIAAERATLFSIPRMISQYADIYKAIGLSH